MANILIIEDEPGIADTIQYALKADGHETEWHGTGMEGLDAIRSAKHDLVIMDIGLPDKNGFELCKEVRKYSNIPIIFLTARKEEIDRIVGIEIGGDDYIVKPFSPRELAARVRAILRRSQNAPTTDEAAQSGVDKIFVVDEARHLISFRSTPLELSRYEYSILKLLISRPGWVFSREKLMEMIWDDPSSSMERTIDSHIKSIRSKLKEIYPEEEIIITHRGVGYSLREKI